MLKWPINDVKRCLRRRTNDTNVYSLLEKWDNKYADSCHNKSNKWPNNYFPV